MSCFVSTCVSPGNLFPSVTQEPSFGPWKGSPFLQQVHAGGQSWASGGEAEREPQASLWGMASGRRVWLSPGAQWTADQSFRAGKEATKPTWCCARSATWGGRWGGGRPAHPQNPRLHSLRVRDQQTNSSHCFLGNYYKPGTVPSTSLTFKTML